MVRLYGNVIIWSLVLNNVEPSKNLTNVLFDDDILFLFDDQNIYSQRLCGQLVFRLKCQRILRIFKFVLYRLCECRVPRGTNHKGIVANLGGYFKSTRARR